MGNTSRRGLSVFSLLLVAVDAASECSLSPIRGTVCLECPQCCSDDIEGPACDFCKAACIPTAYPTATPTAYPTNVTVSPTPAPTVPTAAPTNATFSPSPAPTVSPTLKMVPMKKCPAGKFVYQERNVRLSECVNCAIGTYSDVHDASTCLKCPEGQTTVVKGSTFCQFQSVKSCDDLGWSLEGLGSLLVCGESGAAPLPYCYRAASYYSAKDFCEKVGARLCSIKDLAANEASGSGCNMDMDMVWAVDACEEGYHMATSGSRWSTFAPTPAPTPVPTPFYLHPDKRITKFPTPFPSHRPTKRPTTAFPTGHPTNYPTGYPQMAYQPPQCTTDDTLLSVRCCADKYPLPPPKNEPEVGDDEGSDAAQIKQIVIAAGSSFFGLLLCCWGSYKICERREHRKKTDHLNLVRDMKAVQQSIPKNEHGQRRLSTLMKLKVAANMSSRSKEEKNPTPRTKATPDNRPLSVFADKRQANKVQPHWRRATAGVSSALTTNTAVSAFMIPSNTKQAEEKEKEKQKQKQKPPAPVGFEWGRYRKRDSEVLRQSQVVPIAIPPTGTRTRDSRDM